jgi:ribosomal protein L29
MGNSSDKLAINDTFAPLFKILDNDGKGAVKNAIGQGYDDKMTSVLIKIYSSNTLKKRVGQRIKEACIVFSNPDSLRDIYLNTHWSAQLKALEARFQKTEEDEEVHNTPSYSSKSTELDHSIEEKLTEDLQEKYPELKREWTTVKVKLVIGEVNRTKSSKTFRQFVSPILAKFDLLPEFGMFHSALMIGPWMIDWNDSGIAIPRKCVSQAALISADIGTIGSEQKLEEVVDILAKTICRWNTSKLYKDQPPKHKDEGNCQDFIMDILHELGIKVEFSGPMASFMKKLKDKGKCAIEFDMDDEFREKFVIKEKTIEFKSHQDLDAFVIKCCKIDSDFTIKPQYKDHISLLKSFDRAFWLRHFKFPSDHRFEPCSVDEECCCPFKNPLETGSIVKEEE